MKLCRYDDDRLGLVDGDTIVDVTPALDLLPKRRWPYPLGDALIEHLAAVRDAVERIAPDAARIPLSGAALRSPVANASKIIGAPANYRAHVDEAKRDAGIHHGVHDRGYDPESPIAKLGLFLKATSSVVGPAEGVTIHAPDRRNDHEVEICAVIGVRCRDVPASQALDMVAGYCLGLDMTVRGAEDRSFRKSPDSYTLLGPWLVTADEMPMLDDLAFGLRVNGEARQAARAADMTVGLPHLIELASRTYTLHPGDVIMTGTPEGVGPVVAGDTIEAWCDGIGSFTTVVRGSERPSPA